MSILTCENLVLQYDHVTVLEGISFNVDKGDFLCIVGENGSGKTTLLRAILGLKQPSAGSITCGCERREIGYLPQTAQSQRDFPASAFEVVVSGCMNEHEFMPFMRREQRRVALENMERLGVQNLKNKCFRELSGGQQQRVLLARALCCTKNLMVLDEPVSRLDPRAGRQMYELIAKINKEMGVTIVMVSHDVENALKYADFVLHLCNNKMCFHTAKEYARSEVGSAFLGGHRHE